MAEPTFQSLLPPNATRIERALAQVNARALDLPTPMRDLWNPDTCPAAPLPWLAWSYDVGQWDSAWSDEQKRATIKSTLFVHRHKGTIGSVRGALAALGFTVQVQEWFKQIPAGAPYTFRLLLEASQVGISQAALQHILAVVDNTKNLRSHLALIVPSVVTRNELSVAAASALGSDVAVQYDARLPDVYLMIEGALNGMAATEAAVDALHIQTYW